MIEQSHLLGYIPGRNKNQRVKKLASFLCLFKHSSQQRRGKPLQQDTDVVISASQLVHGGPEEVRFFAPSDCFLES